MSSTFDLVIYGAGGMGQEVADLVESLGCGVWNPVGFVDDDSALFGLDVLGLRVLGGVEWLSGRSVSVAVALGAPTVRRRAWGTLESMGGYAAPPLVHSRAHVGRGCSVGEGSVIAAHAVLTADVIIGRFAIVNVGATVSHNCRLADFATVAPGAHLAGNVHLGEGAEVGIGASIVQGKKVGEWSVVGAGAVVVDDVEANTTVVGCPARVIATRQPGWQK
ncbi:MAG TPA: NeuD/PglB/VioB family sugar acetyltransferase [Acidimicrobiales bacterium]|nr:NeuD/PglB/VioB family sugar acetyltransferase [Acidimicrobiales bacterium]